MFVGFWGLDFEDMFNFRKFIQISSNLQNRYSSKVRSQVTIIDVSITLRSFSTIVIQNSGKAIGQTKISGSISMSTSRIKNALSFKDFVKRQQVLQLYRNLLMKAKSIPNNNELKKSIIEQIRSDFKVSKGITDPMALKSLIQEGHRGIQRIQALNSESATNSDSWINNSDEDDVRGRVGNIWPWQK